MHQSNSVCSQSRLDLVSEQCRVTLLKSVSLFADACEHLGWFEARRRVNREAGGDASFETGNAHHEELIEVRGKNAQKVDSLEKVKVWVFCELQNALVEGQPAQFTV